MCDKGEKNIETEKDELTVLDEEAIKKIVSTPRRKIKESNVFNDLKVSESVALANAKRILESRRNQKS